MLTRLIGVALLAGCLTGLFAAGLQMLFLEPLILKAETFEMAPMKHDGLAMAAPMETASSGVLRPGITVVATIGAAVGFGLMLLAAMVGSEARIDWRTGLAWGVCGFMACGLAPALGLSPALPGAAEGDLTLRQLWWVGTAIATAGGLWLLLRATQSWLWAVGVALLALPHVVGAPHPAAFTSTAPAELASLFAARSLAVQSLLWVALGGLTGLIWARGQKAAL